MATVVPIGRQSSLPFALASRGRRGGGENDLVEMLLAQQASPNQGRDFTGLLLSLAMNQASQTANLDQRAFEFDENLDLRNREFDLLETGQEAELGIAERGLRLEEELQLAQLGRIEREVDDAQKGRVYFRELTRNQNEQAAFEKQGGREELARLSASSMLAKERRFGEGLIQAPANIFESDLRHWQRILDEDPGNVSAQRGLLDAVNVFRGEAALTMQSIVGPETGPPGPRQQAGNKTFRMAGAADRLAALIGEAAPLITDKSLKSEIGDATRAVDSFSDEMNIALGEAGIATDETIADFMEARRLSKQDQMDELFVASNDPTVDPQRLATMAKTFAGNRTRLDVDALGQSVVANQGSLDPMALQEEFAALAVAPRVPTSIRAAGPVGRGMRAGAGLREDVGKGIETGAKATGAGIGAAAGFLGGLTGFGIRPGIGPLPIDRSLLTEEEIRKLEESLRGGG